MEEGTYDFWNVTWRKKEEAFAKGIEKGAYNKSLETAKKLLADNISPEIVVKYTDLPLEVISQLKLKNTPSTK